MKKPNRWVFVNVVFQIFDRYTELIAIGNHSLEVAVHPFSYNIARDKAIRILKGILKRRHGSDIDVVIGLVTFEESPREKQLDLFPSP